MASILERRLGLALALSATFTVAPFALFQYVKHSTWLVSESMIFEPEVLIPHDFADLPFRFLFIGSLTSMSLMALTFLCYVVCRAARLCISDDTSTPLDKLSDFIWNLGFYLLSVTLLSMLLGVCIYSADILSHILATELIFVCVSLPISLAVGTHVAKELSRYKPHFLSPSKMEEIARCVMIPIGFLSYYLLGFWQEYRISSWGQFLDIGLCLVSVMILLQHLGRFFHMQGWSEPLGVRGKVFGVALWAAMSLFVSGNMLPLCSDLQIKYEAVSPQLAVLRIRPTGFADFLPFGEEWEDVRYPRAQTPIGCDQGIGVTFFRASQQFLSEKTEPVYRGVLCLYEFNVSERSADGRYLVVKKNATWWRSERVTAIKGDFTPDENGDSWFYFYFNPSDLPVDDLGFVARVSVHTRFWLSGSEHPNEIWRYVTVGARHNSQN
jgi:hypothetical protein